MSQYQHVLISKSDCNLSLNDVVNPINTVSCTLSHCQLEGINFIGQTPFQKLELLNLDYNNLEKIFIPIHAFPVLECLSIAHNSLTNILASESSFISLKTIRLSGNLLLTIPKFIFSCPSLINLDISENRIQIIDDSDLNQLLALRKLESIDLSGNPCVDSINKLKQINQSLQRIISLKWINGIKIDKEFQKTKYKSENINSSSYKDSIVIKEDISEKNKEIIESNTSPNHFELNNSLKARHASNGIINAEILEIVRAQNKAEQFSRSKDLNINKSSSKLDVQNLESSQSSNDMSSINIMHNMDRVNSSFSFFLEKGTHSSLEQKNNSIYPFNPEMIKQKSESSNQESYSNLTQEEKFERKKRLLDKIKYISNRNSINDDQNSSVEINNYTTEETISNNEKIFESDYKIQTKEENYQHNLLIQNKIPQSIKNLYIKEIGNEINKSQANNSSPKSFQSPKPSKTTKSNITSKSTKTSKSLSTSNSLYNYSSSPSKTLKINDNLELFSLKKGKINSLSMNQISSQKKEAILQDILSEQQSQNQNFSNQQMKENHEIKEINEKNSNSDPNIDNSDSLQINSLSSTLTHLWNSDKDSFSAISTNQLHFTNKIKKTSSLNAIPIHTFHNFENKIKNEFLSQENTTNEIKSNDFLKNSSITNNQNNIQSNLEYVFEDEHKNRLQSIKNKARERMLQILSEKGF